MATVPSGMNRVDFLNRIKDLSASASGRGYVIAAWDIDRFKLFNDLYGMEHGDETLSRLEQLCNEWRSRPGFCACSRFEADHFFFCWESDYFQAEEFIFSVNQLVSEGFGEFAAIPCFGFCSYQPPYIDPAVAADRAMIALRTAKKDYRKHFAWFDETMLTSMQKEQQHTAVLQDALDHEEFIPWYQPQYDYAAGKIVGAEALVRWKKPTGEVVAPGAFIPVMESNGMVSRLDRNIWEQVCRQQRQWLDTGVPVLPVSVNISRIDLSHEDTVSFLCNLIHKYDLPAELIHLEITESAYMDNSSLLFSSIETLRSEGFTVEIDDFGSGFSSLNMLKDIEVDVLKLDMGFLSGNSSRGGSILSSVVSMARNLELDVIAEGVETKPQADYLNSIGCTIMQGYLFSKPIPVEEYTVLLHHTASSTDLKSLKAGRGAGTAVEFLDANTQATLLFNSFVGGAAIIEQNGNRISFLRTNDRFYTELETTRGAFLEKGLFSSDRFSEQFYKGLLRVLETAYETGEERTIELCTNQTTSTPVWTRNHIRFLTEKKGNRLFYLSIENITARHQLQERNRRLASELKATIDSVPGGLARIRVQDDAGSFEFINETLGKLMGYPAADLLSLLKEDPYRFVHPEDQDRLRRAFTFSFESHTPIHLQGRLRRKTGAYIDFDIHGDYSDIPGDGILYLSFADVTGLLKAEASLRRTQAEFVSAIEQSGLMICRYSPEDRALVVSESIAARFDAVTYMPDVREMLVESGYVARESQAAWYQIFDSIERKEAGQLPELCIKGLRGKWRWYSVTWSPMIEGEELQSAILCFRDISEQKARFESQRRELDQVRRSESEIRHKAEHDDLTGLLNRGAVERLVTQHLASRGKSTSLFILVDMDDMKTINDTMGHQCGDEALRKLSFLLTSHFARRNVVIGRLGGDEFVIFIADVTNPSNLPAFLDAFFVKLGQTRIGPSNSVPLRCSLGCVLSTPESDDSFAALYSRADRALYQVKRSLKNYYLFYSPSMDPEPELQSSTEHITLRQRDMFDPDNMNQLLELLSDFYPMVLSLNIDKDIYYLMDSGASFMKSIPKFGHLKELLPLLNAHPSPGRDEVKHFVDGVRKAFSAGKTSLKAFTPQPGEDGEIRQIETVLLMYQDKSGDLCSFALSRQTEKSLPEA